MRQPICQTSIPFDVAPRHLPGVRPLDPADWLFVDDAFAQQMSYRTDLLQSARDRVLQMLPEAKQAADELLDHVLDFLKKHAARQYKVKKTQVTRPDGKRIQINRADPLGTLGELVQEDLCIMQKQDQEHVLTGAVLCFPASWTLSEKIGRPMTEIHIPVDSFDESMAKRVQRLFDGIQIGRPLWRFNSLWYAQADLHQPKSIADPRRKPEASNRRFFRSEKQTMLRLPKTQAVVFSIHTFVLDVDHAPPEALGG